MKMLMWLHLNHQSLLFDMEIASRLPRFNTHNLLVPNL